MDDRQPEGSGQIVRVFLLGLDLYTIFCVTLGRVDPMLAPLVPLAQR